MLHGSFEDKCGLLFDVFNVAGDEGVSYEELTCILSAIAVNTDLMLTTFHHPSSSALLEPETSQQAVKRIADAAFEKCDITGTGKLLPLVSEQLSWYIQLLKSINFINCMMHLWNALVYACICTIYMHTKINTMHTYVHTCMHIFVKNLA